MNYPALLLGMFLVTFLTRFSMFALLKEMSLPEYIVKALHYVPSVVLMSFIIPDLLAYGGTLNMTLSNYRLIAGLTAIFVAHRYRNTVLTVGSGITVLWLLEAFLR